jgi:hypothetical protein
MVSSSLLLLMQVKAAIQELASVKSHMIENSLRYACACAIALASNKHSDFSQLSA